MSIQRSKLAIPNNIFSSVDEETDDYSEVKNDSDSGIRHRYNFEADDISTSNIPAVHSEGTASNEEPKPPSRSIIPVVVCVCLVAFNVLLAGVIFFRDWFF